MTRKSTPPARNRRPARDDVRRRVLGAALAEFTERGYDAASLDRIAAAAGFSKGAIYSNFSGKEDLFLSLMDQQVRHRLDRIAGVVRAGSSSSRRSAGADPSRRAAGRRADVARRAGRTLTELIDADAAWQLLFLEYVARAVRDPARHAELAARRRATRAVVAGSTAEMLGEDHSLWSRFTPDTLAIVMLAVSNGLAIERLVDAEGVPDDLMGRVMTALLG